MRKIYKLLVPAAIAVALLASYATKMDDINVTKEEAVEKLAYIPPKSSLKVPPRL